MWSIHNFTGEELVQLAVKIEEKGHQFYQKIAEQVNEPEAKKIFEYLAGEEQNHIVDFQKLGESVKKGTKPAEQYDGEYEQYVRNLIDTHIFNMFEDEALYNISNDAKGAIDTALRFEKDSILIFMQFKNFVDEEGKKIVKELVAQEQQHINKLNELKKIF